MGKHELDVCVGTVLVVFSIIMNLPLEFSAVIL